LNAKLIFTTAEVARALDTSVQQVRAWTPLVRAEGGAGRYSFRDLVQFRTLKAFKEAGLSRDRIRKALGLVRKSFPSVDSPLSELRFRVEGREVVVELEDRSMTAGGQLLLDLEGEEPRTTVVSLPDLDARLRKGRSLAADLAEAHTDLGVQLLESGHAVDARRELERALLYDPNHTPACRGLAEAYDALGCPVKAEAYRTLAEERESAGRGKAGENAPDMSG